MPKQSFSDPNDSCSILYFRYKVCPSKVSVIPMTPVVFCISGTKYAQAEKFNDPNDSCSILVATDAIGMGLNL